MVNAFCGYVGRVFLPDTFLKLIGREGLGENVTGTTVGNKN